MHGLTVRPAEAADLPILAPIVRAAYTPVVVRPGYLDVAADVAARVDAAEVLVVVDDATGAPIGCVTLADAPGPWREIAEAGETEFRMLAVDPAAQGRGAGAALVRACADVARERGRRALVCSSARTMQAAHQLYARLGFMRAPERDWSPAPGIELMVFELPLQG